MAMRRGEWEEGEWEEDPEEGGEGANDYSWPVCSFAPIPTKNRFQALSKGDGDVTIRVPGVKEEERTPGARTLADFMPTSKQESGGQGKNKWRRRICMCTNYLISSIVRNFLRRCK